MMWVMFAVAALFGLISLACALTILTQFRHPRKGLILVGLVAGALLAGLSANWATAVFGPDVTEAVGLEDFEGDFAAGFDDDPFEAPADLDSDEAAGDELAGDDDF